MINDDRVRNRIGYILSSQADSGELHLVSIALMLVEIFRDFELSGSSILQVSRRF